jgi:3-hydroxyanthranilate 3,4-dioxygenase
VLRAGDLFLLPAKIPHSPRRADGSWTFVIERRRGAEEIDKFIWPCENCGNNLYETEVRFDDPGDAVNRATSSLKSDAALATCKKCGQILDV